MFRAGTLRSYRNSVVCYGGLAAIPFLSLAFLVARYYVDVPFQDEWYIMIPILQRNAEGTLSWVDFLTLHNEHSPFFPRLILFALIQLTRWNVFYELVFSLILAVSLFAVLGCQLSLTMRSSGQGGFLAHLPWLSLCLFSLQQWNIWLVGFMFCVVLSTLVAASGLILLAQREFKGIRFLGALIAGLVVSFSIANGPVYWLVGLMILTQVSFPDRKTKRLAFLIWITVSAGLIGGHTIFYHTSSQHPSLWFALFNPIAYLKYVLAWLGSPLFSFSPQFAWLGGLSGLVLFLLAARRVSLSADSPFLALPYLGLAFYAVGIGLLIGLARSGLGYSQALDPKYIVYSNLFWIALLSFFCLLIKGGGDCFVGWRLARAIVIFTIGFTSLHGASRYPYWREQILPARAALLSMKNEELLSRILSAPQQLREWAPFLKKHRLSVFRDTAALALPPV